MLIELKNVPTYDVGPTPGKLSFSTIDTFENIDMKLTPSSDRDSTEQYWQIAVETTNGKAGYRAPTQEKQQAFYEFVKAALLTKQEFLSINFEDWK